MTRSSRGFTLVEVLVSTVILSLVVTALGTVFIAVQRSYEAISRTRSAMDGSRTAVAYLERQLKLAGYGIDPAIAFDFDAPPAAAGAAKNNDPVTGLTNPAIVTDDLTFRYRDPNWSRRGSVTGGTVTLATGTFGITLRAGRRLLAMCPSGGGYAVYALTGNLAAGASSAAGTLVTTAPFPATAPACLQQTGAGAAHIFMLQERRVRIRNIGGRPFLVAYDVLTAGGNTDFDPIAADVEEFQVAYIMNQQPTGSGVAPQPVLGTDWVLGNDSGDTLPTLAATTAPKQEQKYDSLERYNAHPANIRAVRLSIVTRSRLRDASKKDSEPRLTLEDFTTRAAQPKDGYTRLFNTTTVRVPNMISRTSFTPDTTSRSASSGDGNYNGG